MPALTLPESLGGKEVRLVVREYERYFADRTEAVHDGGSILYKRIVQECLVYAELFPL
jgi:hypothetical protein